MWAAVDVDWSGTRLVSEIIRVPSRIDRVIAARTGTFVSDTPVHVCESVDGVAIEVDGRSVGCALRVGQLTIAAHPATQPGSARRFATDRRFAVAVLVASFAVALLLGAIHNASNAPDTVDHVAALQTWIHRIQLDSVPTAEPIHSQRRAAPSSRGDRFARPPP